MAMIGGMGVSRSGPTGPAGTLDFQPGTPVKPVAAGGAILIKDPGDVDPGELVNIGGRTYEFGEGSQAQGTIEVTDLARAYGIVTAIDWTKFAGTPYNDDITINNYALGPAVKAVVNSGNSPQGFLISDYTLIPAGYVITVGTHGSEALLTEGTDWNAATSNDATAASLSAAINALSEVNSTVTGNRIFVEAASAGVAGNSILLFGGIYGATGVEAGDGNPADFGIDGGLYTGGPATQTLIIGPDIGDFTLLAGKTLTIGSGGSVENYVEGVDWFIGATPSLTLASIRDAVNAGSALATVNATIGDSSDIIGAWTSSKYIKFISTAYGEAGNGVPLFINETGNHFFGDSGASTFANNGYAGYTLDGGRNAASITVGDKTYVAGVDFDGETDNATTASNLADAINGDLPSNVSGAAAVSAVVTVTTDPGIDPSAMSITSNNGSFASVATLHPTGGTRRGIITVGDKTYDPLTDFDAETDEATTAANLADAITSDLPTNVASAVAVGAVVTITSDTGFDLSVALSSLNTAAATVSDAQLNYTATVSVDGNVLVGGTDFDIETDEDTTAANLATAIDGISSVSASSTGPVVTIVAVAFGTGGNDIDLATSDSDAFTLSDSHLDGGTGESPAPGHVAVDMAGDHVNVLHVLRDVINADDDSPVTATGDDDSIEVTAKVAGADGNDIGVDTTAANLHWDPDALTGGVDGTESAGATGLYDNDYLYVSVLPSTKAVSNWKRFEAEDLP